MRPGARWYLKKTARAAVMYTSWGLGKTGQSGRSSNVARVLTYHRFGDDLYDPFCVSSRDFESQVRMLAEEGRAIDLAALENYVSGRQELPANACLVTIDDGMLSTLTEALPILAKWNVPAIAYVSAGLVGRGMDSYGERYLGWSELRELAGSGIVEIGSHAFSHRSLGLMPLKEAEGEAVRSRELLQQELGNEVRSFAYPFGTRTDFNDATEQCLSKAGYSIAFHSMHGAIHPGSNLMSLPRVKIEGGENLRQFSLVSRGGTDLWSVVDNTLWRMQRSRVEIE